MNDLIMLCPFMISTKVVKVPGDSGFIEEIYKRYMEPCNLEKCMYYDAKSGYCGRCF